MSDDAEEGALERALVKRESELRAEMARTPPSMGHDIHRIRGELQEVILRLEGIRRGLGDVGRDQSGPTKIR